LIFLPTILFKKSNSLRPPHFSFTEHKMK